MTFSRAICPYTSTSYSKQQSLDPETNSGDSFTARSQSYKLRLGRRFSSPGDTSYFLTYFGVRSLYFHSPVANLSISAQGFYAGAYGFYSHGLYHNMEFVLTGEFYAGNYILYHFSSGLDYTSVNKKYSVSAGGSLGIGIQYEPNNITMLLKLASDTDFLVMTARHDTSGRGFIAGTHCDTVGVELIYAIPSEQYNASGVNP